MRFLSTKQDLGAASLGLGFTKRGSSRIFGKEVEKVLKKRKMVKMVWGGCISEVIPFLC